MKFQIAIDGPSGVGKSTVAKKVASSLNFVYVNTGLLFRTVAYYYDHDDQKDLEAIVKTLDANDWIDYEGEDVFLKKQPITNELKDVKISQLASIISKNVSVRNYIHKLEKKLSLKHNVVMEGRDIGTVIFPQATLKIFLTASTQVRAQRRFLELKTKNLLTAEMSLEQMEFEIAERDHRDKTRSLAPLIQAEDAYLINTDNQNIEAIVVQIQELFLEKIKNNH